MMADNYGDRLFRKQLIQDPVELREGLGIAEGIIEGSASIAAHNLKPFRLSSQLVNKADNSFNVPMPQRCAGVKVLDRLIYITPNRANIESGEAHCHVCVQFAGADYAERRFVHRDERAIRHRQG